MKRSNISAPKSAGEALRRGDRQLYPGRGAQRGQPSLAQYRAEPDHQCDDGRRGDGYTVWGWSQGRFTPGDVVLVNSLLMQLFRPLDLLGWVYRSIRQGLIDMEAMFDLTDTRPRWSTCRTRPHWPSLTAMWIEEVAFGYEPERIILKGVTLDVPAGTSLAVVGPSGAGKSTLARRIYRFYDPTAGKITIDGQDIAAVKQDSLRAAIGIVPQDTVLFNDTIGYNIGYGRGGRARPTSRAPRRCRDRPVHCGTAPGL